MISLSLHEKKSHGTESFPAEYYYVDASHPRYQMPFHWHREWELIRVIRGEVLFTVENEEYYAHTGDFLIIPEGLIHGGTPTSADSVYECIVFSLSGLFSGSIELSRLISPFVRLEKLPNILYPFSDDNPYFAPLTNAMAACAEVYSRPDNADGCKLIMISNIGCLFGLVLKNGDFSSAPENASSAQRSFQLKPVFEYIEQNYASAVSLETLSSLAGLNPKYFCQVFREITHRTPMDYVIFYRIEQACVLLSTTPLSVTAISMMCGFNDSGYFTKQFRKLTGTTPLKYRKQFGVS